MIASTHYLNDILEAMEAIEIFVEKRMMKEEDAAVAANVSKIICS